MLRSAEEILARADELARCFEGNEPGLGTSKTLGRCATSPMPLRASLQASVSWPRLWPLRG